MAQQPGMFTNDQGEAAIPADLRPTDLLLADLAASDLRSAPSGLSRRVFESTRTLLEGERSAPISIARIPRSHWSSRSLMTPLRVAAGIAFLATAGVTWIAGRGPSGGSDPRAGSIAGAGAAGDRNGSSASTRVEQDITEWLAMSNTSFVSDIDVQRTSLDADATGLLQLIENGESTDWSDDGVSGGAM